MNIVKFFKKKLLKAINTPGLSPLGFLLSLTFDFFEKSKIDLPPHSLTIIPDYSDIYPIFIFFSLVSSKISLKM